MKKTSFTAARKVPKRKAGASLAPKAAPRKSEVAPRKGAPRKTSIHTATAAQAHAEAHAHAEANENVREDWLRSRKALLRQTQAQVQARLGPESSEVAKYRKANDRELSRRFKISTKAELIEEISSVEVFYGGDFHALGQAQRTHLRILRSLELQRPIVLALEAFPESCQKQLDLFMSGKLSLDELPRSVNWTQNWGFPFENYRPLLELAFKNKFKLIALNHPGKTLKQRDRLAAQAIERVLTAQTSAQMPLVYVIFGELHLAQEHLPRELERCLGRSVKSLTLYVSSSRIYFQLARQDLEQTTDLVKISRGIYCAMTSPPWVQWQSYLLFLEQTGDLDLDSWDGDDDDEENDFESEPDFDPTDHVTSIAKVLAGDFKLNAKQMKFGDISIYGSADERLWKYLKKSLSKKDQELVQELISNHRSFLIPSSGIGYMAHPTVNHAAYLAGQYLHSKLSARKRPIWDFPQDFHALIWQEAVGFFASKLINHKRVAESLRDLQAQLPLATEAQKDILKLVLDQRMTELVFLQDGRRRPLKFKPRRRSSYLEAARILGAMLGERLYLTMRSRKLALSELLGLLRLDVESKGESKIRSSGKKAGKEMVSNQTLSKSYDERLGQPRDQARGELRGRSSGQSRDQSRMSSEMMSENDKSFATKRPKKSALTEVEPNRSSEIMENFAGKVSQKFSGDFSRDGFDQILLFLSRKLGKLGESTLERGKSKKERL